jgi:adenosylhomocysteine nucleosidase
MRILAVAAEAMEARPWLKGCGHAVALPWGLVFAQKATCQGAEIYAVADGPGPRLAAGAVDTAVREAGPFDVAVSFGLCGGLDPSLGLHAICSATAVSDGATVWPAVPVPGAAPVKLLSIDRFVGKPEDKREWAGKGFGAVEMEAAAVARYAASRQIPFHAVKIVSDRADETFALDFNRYRDAAGRFARARIALAAMAHPFRYAPDLYRLASRGPAASETLGVFLSNARF